MPFDIPNVLGIGLNGQATQVLFQRCYQPVVFALDLIQELCRGDRRVLGTPGFVKGHDGAPVEELTGNLVDHGARYAGRFGELIAGDRVLLEQGQVGLGLIFGETDVYQSLDKLANHAPILQT